MCDNGECEKATGALKGYLILAFTAVVLLLFPPLGRPVGRAIYWVFAEGGIIVITGIATILMGPFLLWERIKHWRNKRA